MRQNILFQSIYSVYFTYQQKQNVLYVIILNKINIFIVDAMYTTINNYRITTNYTGITFCLHVRIVTSFELSTDASLPLALHSHASAPYGL